MDSKQEVKKAKKHGRLAFILLALIAVAASSFFFYRFVHAKKKQQISKPELSNQANHSAPAFLLGADVTRDDISELKSWIQSQPVDCGSKFYNKINEIEDKLRNRESYLNALSLVEDRVYSLRPVAVMDDESIANQDEQGEEKSWLSWLKIKRISANHVVARTIDIDRAQTRMLLSIEQLYSQVYHPIQSRMDHIFHRLKKDALIVNAPILGKEVEALSHWQAHALQIPHGLLTCEQRGDRYV